jgi:hypothetical protein
MTMDGQGSDGAGDDVLGQEQPLLFQCFGQLRREAPGAIVAPLPAGEVRKCLGRPSADNHDGVVIFELHR